MRSGSMPNFEIRASRHGFGRHHDLARRRLDPLDRRVSAQRLDESRQLMDPRQDGDLPLREGRMKIADGQRVADRDPAARKLVERSGDQPGTSWRCITLLDQCLDLQRGGDPRERIRELPTLLQHDPTFDIGKRESSSASRRRQSGAPVRQAECETRSILK